MQWEKEPQKVSAASGSKVLVNQDGSRAPRHSPLSKERGEDSQVGTGLSQGPQWVTLVFPSVEEAAGKGTEGSITSPVLPGVLHSHSSERGTAGALLAEEGWPSVADTHGLRAP